MEEYNMTLNKYLDIAPEVLFLVLSQIQLHLKKHERSN